MRTLVDLPDDDIQWLDRLAADQGRSRAAIVREAISAYRAEAGKDWIGKGAGYWRHRTDIGDPIAYQQGMRRDRDDPSP